MLLLHLSVMKYKLENIFIQVNRLTGDLRKGGNEDLTKVNNFTIQIVQLKLEKEDLE